MTNEPETPLDVVIDEVAHDMLAVTTPNLRSRVSARLDTRATRTVVWRPVLAGLVVACAAFVAFLTWDRGNEDVPPPRPPVQAELPNQDAPPTASIAPRREQVARRPERRRFRAADVAPEWPHLQNDIDAIDVTPIEIDALQIPIAGIDPMDVEHMSIAPITVAPLSPIADEEPR